jgi:GTP:adenosylcobinamide-phosphate guanylyltransferase
MSGGTLFTAVILAGDRAPDDPVARAARVPCKALVPVGGVPMALRVLQALDQAQEVGGRILCGPAWQAVESTDELYALVSSGQVKWVHPQASPSASAVAAMRSIPRDSPVLVTTADQALLTAPVVDYFCAQARARDCDVVVGLTSYERVASAWPGIQRTVVKLRDGSVCGCNMYAFLTSEGRSLAEFWRRVETERKKPIKLISTLGWVPVLQFLVGALSLRNGLTQLSRRAGVSIDAVMLPFPEAAIDVDKVSDWVLAQKIAGTPSS